MGQNQKELDSGTILCIRFKTKAYTVYSELLVLGLPTIYRLMALV